jgi:glycosyltransferase involved in cell wall biosynthesis
VIVDTDSTDRTIEVARTFGARVFEFPWIYDFAAARNEALAHATCNYAFWLDADDLVALPEREKLIALLNSLVSPAPLRDHRLDRPEALCPDRPRAPDAGRNAGGAADVRRGIEAQPRGRGIVVP